LIVNRDRYENKSTHHRCTTGNARCSRWMERSLEMMHRFKMWIYLKWLIWYRLFIHDKRIYWVPGFHTPSVISSFASFICSSKRYIEGKNQVLDRIREENLPSQISQDIWTVKI
jgi:hypothetical protein